MLPFVQFVQNKVDEHKNYRDRCLWVYYSWLSAEEMEGSLYERREMKATMKNSLRELCEMKVTMKKCLGESGAEEGERMAWRPIELCYLCSWHSLAVAPLVDLAIGLRGKRGAIFDR